MLENTFLLWLNTGIGCPKSLWSVPFCPKLGRVLSKLIVDPAWVGGWTSQSQDIPSNLNNSVMIRCRYLRKIFLCKMFYVLDVTLIHLHLVQVASVAWSLVRNPLVWDVPSIKHNGEERRGKTSFLTGKSYNSSLCVLYLVSHLYSFSDWLLFLSAFSWPTLPQNYIGENVSKAILCSYKHISNIVQWSWLKKGKNDSIKMYRDVFWDTRIMYTHS